MGGNVLDDACWRVLRLQKGKESKRQVDQARKVDVHLIMESCKIDVLRLGEIVDALGTGIEVDAVEIRVRAGHILYELAQVLAVGDVEGDSARLGGTMLASKVVDTVMSAAHGNDFAAFLDELLCHA